MVILARRSLTLQAHDAIRELMVSEHLDSGAQLPTEVELATRLGVGRTTVREAFKLLEQDGIVHTIHGRGRYVAPFASLAVERPITRFESTTQMFESVGQTVVNRVLDLRQRPATAEEALTLHLAAGAPLLHLERLRLHGDRAVIYSVDLIDASLLPPTALTLDWSGSVIALLSAHGADIVSSVARVSAATLPKGAGRRPELAGQAAWLLIRELCVLDSGRPVLLAHDYHRGDVFSFHVLRRRGERAGASGAYSRSLEMDLKS